MVILLRRLIGLLMAALLMSLAVATSAMADGQAVIDDYEDNGQIEACYSDADFVAALRLAQNDLEQYGAAVDVIEQKQVECAEGVQPQPVTAPAEDDGGGGVLWVILGGAAIAGLGAFAYVAWTRRSPDSES